MSNKNQISPINYSNSGFTTDSESKTRNNRIINHNIIMSRNNQPGNRSLLSLTGAVTSVDVILETVFEHPSTK